jgi:hypothetical protein
MAACHAQPAKKPRGPRPGGSVQRGKWPTARRRGAGAGRAHDAVTACSSCVRWRGGVLTGGSMAAGQRQGVTGELRGDAGHGHVERRSLERGRRRRGVSMAGSGSGRWRRGSSDGRRWCSRGLAALGDDGK